MTYISSTGNWLPSRSRMITDPVSGRSELQAWPKHEVRLDSNGHQIGIFAWNPDENGCIEVEHFKGFRAEVIQRAKQIADAFNAEFIDESTDA